MDPVCAAPADDDVDAQADETIARCVTASPPVSFFLSAGAGSGKTRSLVRALDVIRSEVAAEYRLRGQHVGVITFTNKACDEIRRRLAYDPLFSVSTIHNFAWSLIGRHNTDVRERLKADLRAELVELGEKERTGRTGSRASLDRQAAIAALGKRVEILDEVRSFIYSPDGDNLERNALSHAEVIRISSVLVSEKPLMQELLVTRFPILLIDESQDTDKLLLDALLRTQYECPNRFCLGVIGDAMQRIYLAGRLDIAEHVPPDWAKPVKLLNHRSGRRIVELVNRIRAPIDGQEQRSRRDRGEGVVRLFVLPAGVPDKSRRESSICHRMAEVTADEAWRSPRENVKTLVLEHHMAASRLDFLPMWQALDRGEALKTGLRDGSLPAIGFYSELILPLVKAYRHDDKFAVASLVRKRSPLLDRHRVEACGTEQVAQLALARQAVDDLCQLWSDNDNPSFLDVLRRAVESGLFGAPEALRPFLEPVAAEPPRSRPEEDDGRDETGAWRAFLETPFAQIEPYSQYMRGEAAYDTHQGIKGLEFPRVCVIMDDTEARGFMFSYEKLFGAKPDSPQTDPERETQADRTRRLFYVTCSRAQEGLALVAYTSSPDKVRGHVLNEGWFNEAEVEVLAN